MMMANTLLDLRHSLRQRGSALVQSSLFTKASAVSRIPIRQQAGRVGNVRHRFANLEIAYLSQGLEGHDGLGILATNLQHNIDDAFTP